MFNTYMIRHNMVQIDDILGSKKWAAEKSDIDEGCLVLSAYLACNTSIWESHYLIAGALVWNVFA